jgi:hypothetical protein
MNYINTAHYVLHLPVQGHEAYIPVEEEGEIQHRKLFI